MAATSRCNRPRACSRRDNAATVEHGVDGVAQIVLRDRLLVARVVDGAVVDEPRALS